MFSLYLVFFIIIYFLLFDKNPKKGCHTLHFISIQELQSKATKIVQIQSL